MGDSIRSLLRRTSSCHQPWQLSTALALGVVCGLLPKFSLLFCAIAVVCCCLPIHLPLAAATCFMLSFAVGPLTQTAGRAGLWSLAHSGLSDMWSSLDSLPWLTWVGLNNTVVHGSLLIGLGLALPIFLLTRPLVTSMSPARAADPEMSGDPDFIHELKPVVAARTNITRSEPLTTTPLVTLPERHKPTQSTEGDWSALSECGADLCSSTVSIVDENTCHELEKLLATCSADEANNVGAPQVAQRAAQMAQYVDDLLATCDLNPPPPVASPPVDAPAAKAQPRGVEHCAATEPNSTADPLAVRKLANTPAPASTSGSTRFIHHPQEQSVIQPYVQPAEPSGNPSAAKDGRGTPKAQPHKDRVMVEVSQRQPIADTQQAETLRYLLEHLRAIKDKV